jgi:hypothetical protein
VATKPVEQKATEDVRPDTPHEGPSTAQLDRLHIRIDISDITGGFFVPIDTYVTSSARVVTDEDPFASALVRKVAALVPFIKDSAGADDYQLVQWPDGLMAIVRNGLTKAEYGKALVRAYESAFVQLVHGMQTAHLFDEAHGQ